MEDDAARPKPTVGQASPSSDLTAKQRLEQLEREAAALREQISNPGAAPEPEPEPEPDLPPPTPEQLAAADNFIRQARLARSRNQGQQANEFLKRAEEAAPNAPAVLEFIGDDFLERKQFKQARALYQKALKYQPKNVALERKFAQTVLSTTALGSAAMYSEFEVAASKRWATLFSAIIPGAGQIVTGEYVKGGVMAGLWAACISYLIWKHEQFSSLFVAMGYKPHYDPNHPLSEPLPPFDAKILIPLFIAFIIWIIALFDMKLGGGDMGGPKPPPQHPTPPANLPFE